MHSSSAGVEKLLFTGLVESDVTLTNAKGVYSHSLAEYALTCCSWFAKDLPRMRAAQKRGEWDAFEVEELRGANPAALRMFVKCNLACPSKARASSQPPRPSLSAMQPQCEARR